MSSIEKIRLGVLKIRQDLIFPADDGEIDPIDKNSSKSTIKKVHRNVA